MPHRFLPSMLLACVLLAGPALAQPGAAPKPPAPASADALTPDQAKRALETLQDDAKRAQIIDTLRAIAKISPDKVSSPAPTNTPAPEPQQATPLTADSLGAQLL